MGDIKNLTRKEAISKMRELSDSIRTCMFCTRVTTMPFEARPMTALEVDDDGNIWFFSSAISHKNLELKQDDQVQLIYAQPSDSHFMTIYGHADIIIDRQKAEDLWNVFAKAWFKEGKDDPELTLIRVQPTQSYYWDTKFGRMITLLALATSAITGKYMDAGVEGNLNV